MTSSRQLLIAAIVLGLLSVGDFARRIYIPRDAALRSYAPPTLPDPPAAPDLKASESALESWLPALRATVQADPTSTGPDDWVLKLVGTFEERHRRFAVIMATARSGGRSERRRVAAGDVVYGRTVVAVGRGSLALSAPTGAEELKVFGRHPVAN